MVRFRPERVASIVNKSVYEFLPGVASSLMVRIFILLRQLVFHAKTRPVPFGTRTGFLPELSPNPQYFLTNLSLIALIFPRPTFSCVDFNLSTFPYLSVGYAG